MFWFLTQVPTFGSSLWKKWRRWLFLRHSKRLHWQTRLCRQTRHVALGCSQIYTHTDRLRNPQGFFSPFVWVYMFLTCPLMSFPKHTFVCVLEICGMYSFLLSCPGIPLFLCHEYLLRWGSWSLSVTGNPQLGTCLILPLFCLSWSQAPGTMSFGKRCRRREEVEGKRDTTTERKAGCLFLNAAVIMNWGFFLRHSASCKSLGSDTKN